MSLRSCHQSMVSQRSCRSKVWIEYLHGPASTSVGAGGIYYVFDVECFFYHNKNPLLNIMQNLAILNFTARDTV